MRRQGPHTPTPHPTEPNAPEAILKTLHETQGLTEPRGVRLRAGLGQAVFTSQDAKEGPRAFAEKRKANFQRR